jgi:hypothetical protein
VLTDEQKARYEQTRQMAKAELDQIDKEIESELTRVKERLLELQQAKKAIKQIYDGACTRLGIKSSLEIKDLNLSDLGKQG